MDELKEVYFDKYCGTCKHCDADGNTEPCDSCLSAPVNVNSHKPVNYICDEKLSKNVNA